MHDFEQFRDKLKNKIENIQVVWVMLNSQWNRVSKDKFKEALNIKPDWIWVYATLISSNKKTNILSCSLSESQSQAKCHMYTISTYINNYIEKNF